MFCDDGDVVCLESHVTSCILTVLHTVVLFVGTDRKYAMLIINTTTTVVDQMSEVKVRGQPQLQLTLTQRHVH